MTIPYGLLEWARLPGPATVLAAARRRLEAGHSMSGSPLRVRLTEPQRTEVGHLLGTRWALSGRAVGAKALTKAIESAGSDLVSLLTVVSGPLRDRPTERIAERDRADAECIAARDTLLSADVPRKQVETWLSGRSRPRPGTGRLSALAERVGRAWQQLPTGNETVSLASLAATSLHNPHALDRGSPTAKALLRLATDGRTAPRGAEAWRNAWEALGVVCDPLSSRVLVLNLPLTGHSSSARLASAAAGEPLWLTWRSLREPFGFSEPDVYVCENPAVVFEAAERLGTHSRPLVCTNGRPSGAVRRLLAGLSRSQARIHLSADDDVAGQDIVAGLRILIPSAHLWRYTIRPNLQAKASPHYEEQDLDILMADLTPPIEHIHQ